MVTAGEAGWERLEQWSPRLFFLAGAFLLVAASESGLALLVESYTHNTWLGIVLELGRLTALLGTAGLSAGLVDRTGRFGKLGRAVATLAVALVVVLIGLATLKKAGFLANPIGVVGIVTYGLSVGTFALFGAGILRTGAYSTRVGSLLLVNVVALLVVFFGRLVVPLELLATVVPATQVLLYFGVGHRLRIEHVPAPGTTPRTEPSS